ncbi:MAG: hypothetical protein HOV66_27875 [Streptomycetaceae bacterium]|nr:hypothetical protein [Nocardioidaceae bacterium]NUS58638.1 hypothetical protein [Streptomycetaceae bacterium]
MATLHCPDCLGLLHRRPSLRQDARCRPCRREVNTRDARRRAKAAARRREQPTVQVDAYV